MSLALGGSSGQLVLRATQVEILGVGALLEFVADCFVPTVVDRRTQGFIALGGFSVQHFRTQHFTTQ
jgi:hypothetical protein